MGHFTGNWVRITSRLIRFNSSTDASQGMEYDYVGEADSRSFGDAPGVIMASVGRLTWAGEHVVNNGSLLPFNELLVLGYLEGQDIGVSALNARSCHP